MTVLDQNLADESLDHLSHTVMQQAGTLSHPHLSVTWLFKYTQDRLTVLVCFLIKFDCSWESFPQKPRIIYLLTLTVQADTLWDFTAISIFWLWFIELPFFFTNICWAPMCHTSCFSHSKYQCARPFYEAGTKSELKKWSIIIQCDIVFLFKILGYYNLFLNISSFSILEKWH